MIYIYIYLFFGRRGPDVARVAIYALLRVFTPYLKCVNE